MALQSFVDHFHGRGDLVRGLGSEPAPFRLVEADDPDPFGLTFECPAKPKPGLAPVEREQ